MLSFAASPVAPAPVTGLEPLSGLLGWLFPFVVILGLLKLAATVVERKAKRRGGRSRRMLEADWDASRQSLERAFEKSSDVSSVTFPYRLDAKSYFFSRAEGAFYPKLVEAARELELLVFPKVGLCDLFVDRGDAERGQYQRYSQMHVDYLLVRLPNYVPVAGIELNGPSHQEESQQINDRKKKAVFAAASLPLITFYNQPDYSVWEIQSRLQDIVGPVTFARPSQGAAGAQSDTSKP